MLGHYRRDIDGLRAVAVLAVLLFHVHSSLLPGGFIGVDIFFVISGYLITGILQRDLAANQFSLRRFYARRVRRIFTPRIVVLAAALVMGWFLLLPEEYAQLGKHSWGAAAFIANAMLWKEAGYFDSATALKPLMHLWSLGVEEQFYIIWPLLLAAAWRWRRMGQLLIALAALSLLASLVFTPTHPTASFFLPHTRFWEFAVGGLLARYESRLHLSTALHNGLSVAGAAILVLSMRALAGDEAYPGWRATLPVLGSALVIAAGPHAAINRLLGAQLPVAIGLVSYPLYLWHWLLISLTTLAASGNPSIKQLACAAILSLPLAVATYALVERPIRFGNGRHATMLPMGLAACMLLLAVAGITLEKRDGFAQARSMEGGAFADLARLDAFRATLVRCADGASKDLSWCYQNRPGPADFALFGDSHADALFPGLVQTDRDHTWLLVGQSSCPPLLDVAVMRDGHADECVQKNRIAVNALAQPSIRTVVLSAVHGFYLGHSISPQHTGKNAPARYRLRDGSGDDAAAIYRRGLQRTIAALRQAGKRVVIVSDLPQFSMYPSRCMARPWSLGAPQCRLPRGAMDAAQTTSKSLLATLNVPVYDAAPLFCNAQHCRIGESGMLYYRDSHHLSVRGAERLARAFLPWLAQQR